MTNNIMKTFNKATPAMIRNGVAWYKRAKRECNQIAKDTGLPLWKVVGVASALSPNNKWDRNVLDARNMCEAYVNNAYADIWRVKVCTYNPNKRKALLVLGLSNVGQVKSLLNGKKIVAFYSCIMGEDTCVVDGHAKNIYYGKRYTLTDSKSNVGVREYKVIADAYIATAKAVNRKLGTKYKAFHVQAITWVAWREMHGIA